MEQDGTFLKLPKKEVIGLKKEYEKLNKILCGIREMKELPKAMFIVDPSKEEIAIKEARKLNIPVFGIVDTNCDPDMVDYVIPGNDEAIKSIKLIAGVMANAIVEANGGAIVDYVADDKKEVPADFMKRAVEAIKKKEPKSYDDNYRGRRFPKDKRRENKRFFKDNKKVEKTNKKEVKENITNEPKKEEATVKKAVVDLSTKTVSELREMAKVKEIKGYSTMKKAELLETLK